LPLRRKLLKLPVWPHWGWSRDSDESSEPGKRASALVTSVLAGLVATLPEVPAVPVAVTLAPSPLKIAPGVAVALIWMLPPFLPPLALMMLPSSVSTPGVDGDVPAVACPSRWCGYRCCAEA